MLLKKELNKICLTLIFIGLSYSIFYSIFYTKKFDRFFLNSEGVETHYLIKNDTYHYWNAAELYKTDIQNGKDILKSGGELERNYLYPKIIAVYYLLIQESIKDENGRLKLNNYKFGIPIFQSLLFYVSLLFLYSKIKSQFDNIIVIYIVLFLSLNPSIIQFHAAYWTESIYFSLLLIFLSFLINLPKKNYKYFLFGIFLGIMYMQRGVTLLLFIPLVFYFFWIYRYAALKKCGLFIFGYFLVLLFIGYENYQKSGFFYFTTFTQSNAHYNYVSHILNAKKFNIGESESLKLKISEKNNFLIKNKIDIDTDKLMGTANVGDMLKVSKYERDYFLQSLKSNFVYFAKYHLYKSMQGMIIGYDYVTLAYTRDKSQSLLLLKKNDYKKHIYSQIFYSLVIYGVLLIGTIRIILSKSKKYKNMLFIILLMSAYNIAMLGWMGVGRYLAVNHIFYSILFGFGFENIINFIRFNLFRK